MGQYAMTVTLVDNKTTEIINGLKFKIPALPGETDTAYLKRAAGIALAQIAKEGMRINAINAVTVEDPSFTVT